jgi:hypothetical protein
MPGKSEALRRFHQEKERDADDHECEDAGEEQLGVHVPARAEEKLADAMFRGDELPHQRTHDRYRCSENELGIEDWRR